ncbi:MAG: trypsin-like peptidase domain-containing protein [bacterium]|nr:trypsin-like peptidase domain-containing protein [bacterium]
MDEDAAKRAVVAVGEGRGFVVEAGGDRFIITAGHCLPRLPPATSFLASETVYRNLTGRLYADRRSLTVECLFVDPIADIAVLGAPDGQDLWKENEAYQGLVDVSQPLMVTAAPKDGPAKLLSLDGRWGGCTIRHDDGPLWVFDAKNGIEGGMSGSPIIAETGAIGVLVTGSGAEGGPQPNLMLSLPGWLLARI